MLRNSICNNVIEILNVLICVILSSPLKGSWLTLHYVDLGKTVAVVAVFFCDVKFYERRSFKYTSKKPAFLDHLFGCL